MRRNLCHPAKGAMTSQVKLALLEMHRFGAIERKERGWWSCNGACFRNMTALTLLRWGMAVYSINARLPGREFIRLSEKGITMARALHFERRAWTLARKAQERVNAEVIALQPNDDFESAVEVYQDEGQEFSNGDRLETYGHRAEGRHRNSIMGRHARHRRILERRHGVLVFQRG